MSLWLFWIIAGLLFAGAAALVTIGLWGDRAKGRLRCPKCWHDMAEIFEAETLNCPQCSHIAPTEQDLSKARRRWKPVIIASLLLAPFAYGGYLYHGWSNQQTLIAIYERHRPKELLNACPNWVAACIPPELAIFQHRPPVDVDSGKSSDGLTVLHLTVKDNNALGVSTLLRHGADPLIEGPRHSPFHEAASGSLPEVMYVMLSYGVPIDSTTRHGSTALKVSLEGRNEAMTRFLLTFRANIDIADQGGNTPLHIAVQNADEKMVRLLLDFGANPLVLNDNLLRPLDEAELYCPKMLRLLKRAAVDKQKNRD